MSLQDRPLEVIIVGGGLAGALAARVLREKHNVRIYERMRTPQDVGAAINVGPNGVRILDTLNFDRSKAGSMPVGVEKIFNKEGNLVIDKHTKYAETYGADWLFHHRADLRAEFLRLATANSKESGIPGRPAELHWNAHIVDVDPEQGKVVLASGQELFGDLIVAADGIKSGIRPYVIGNSAFSTARPSGMSAFRFTLDTQSIIENLGRKPEILQSDKPVCLSIVYSFDDSKKRVVIYPCWNFEILNFVCIVPDDMLKEEATESWSAAGDREELLIPTSWFHAETILDADFPTNRLAKDIKLWQLRDQDPLPTYIRGRTVLIGDAAHAMTPHQGQGGTQAVEDAEGFRLFLQPGTSRMTVPQLLKDFDSVRRPRASQIQDNTRKSHDKRTADDIHTFEKINWTYPGILEGLRRVKSGENIVQLSN
ncbi:salicylate 1-monooxygenase [Curvularia clavata]|uniref:Salicylate 1-monooxygenase n=1 Tax=Curvularia clavata TaxID=95742 RepID=A0A9Q9DS83_CURCL|nr:salicylate 1-monooxygenase [Curvularia clavata]